MKTTPPRTRRRPTASADRPGDDLPHRDPGRAAPEPRCCGPRRAPGPTARGGPFTGGETLH